MSEITAVIFDVGNVMVRWEPRVIFEPHLKDSAELDWFMDQVITMDWHKHHDAGLSFAEGVKNRSAEFPDYAHLISLFDSQWDDTITGVITETIDCMKALKEAGIPMFGLTNFNGPKFQEFRKKYDFIDLLDDVVVSGDEKLIKPDPAIYDLILNRFNLIPEQTLFIDDSLDNIKAAEAKEIKTHHFTDPQKLWPDLKRCGLL